MGWLLAISFIWALCSGFIVGAFICDEIYDDIQSWLGWICFVIILIFSPISLLFFLIINVFDFNLSEFAENLWDRIKNCNMILKWKDFRELELTEDDDKMERLGLK